MSFVVVGCDAALLAASEHPLRTEQLPVSVVSQGIRASD